MFVLQVDEEVVAMLKRTFPDLADRGIIEDVLVSVSNPDKAFEQLQILQVHPPSVNGTVNTLRPDHHRCSFLVCYLQPFTATHQ